MEKVKQYVIGADIIRILSGFGVVLIHVTDPFLNYPPYEGIGGLSWWMMNILNTAFRFSVPVFLMLSGYLLLNPRRTDTFENFYQKRFLRIGIPFAFWLVVYFIWIYFLDFNVTPYYIFLSILSVNLQHLYFLFIIVELYFIAPILIVFNRETTKKAHTIFAIASSIFTIAVAMSSYFVEDAAVLLGHNVFTIFIPFISYFYLGFYLRNVRLSLTQKIWAVNGYLNLVLITVLLSNGEITSIVRGYGSPTIFFMCILVFMVLLRNSMFEKLIPHMRIVNIIKQVSGTIFGVYLVHMLVITGLDSFFRLRPGDIYSPLWGWVMFKVFLVFFISYAFVTVGQKIPKVKILFG